MSISNKIKVLSSSAGYELAANNYDKKEAYLNSFEQRKLIPLLGDVRGKTILDVGAGTGRLSLPLAAAGAEVTALDIAPAMLDVLRHKNGRIKTALGDAEDLPFAAGTFDIVIAAFLIVHLSNPTRFFDEAYRVLKPGGLLIFTNINQKKAPEIETKIGTIKIESFYHQPEKIKEILEYLAFSMEKEVIVCEGEAWVNQIVAARK